MKTRMMIFKPLFQIHIWIYYAYPRLVVSVKPNAANLRTGVFLWERLPAANKALERLFSWLEATPTRK